MKTPMLSLAFAVAAYTPLLDAKVEIAIDATKKQHQVHPMIQGHGLVYSEEADSIYEDGSMAALYQEVGAGFLRWPGGTVATMYHWNDLTGVGWIDKWDPNYNTANNADPSEYMDLDEYIALSQSAGTEPMLGINMSSGIEWGREEEALQEMRDMINYCLSQGFNVKYFYLDNETYHHGNGHNKDPNNDGKAWTPKIYAEQINIYAAAIKELVPDAKLIANWTDKVRANTSAYTTLINTAGHNIDYIDVHWYWKWGESTWSAWKQKTPMENETSWYDGGTFVEEIDYFNNFTASLGKPHIKLAALEWNIAPGDHNTNPSHTAYQTALMASEMQMQFIQGGIELASMWTTQWANSSTAEFQFLVNSDDDYAPAPMANVFKLYKHAIGGRVVSANVSDGSMISAAVIKDDKAYVWVINKKDNYENGEFSIDGYDVLSVESAYRFSDPGVLSTIGLWNDATTGNYMATLEANTLTMVEFNVEPMANESTVENGGFEQGLQGWDTWNNPQVVSNDVFAGSNALKMTDKGSINQWLAVEQSKTYELSGYLKISDTNEHVVLGVNDSNNNGIESTEISSASYRKHKTVFTTGANETEVKIYAWLPPSNGASAYVDNVELKLFSAEVINGGFEQDLLNWNSWNPVSITNTNTHSGSKAAVLNGNASVNQIIDVLPNTSYTISGYVMVEDPDNSKVVFGVKDADTNTLIDKADVYDSSYSLKQFSFTTGSDTRRLKIYFWRPKAGVQNAYLDAVTID